MGTMKKARADGTPHLATASERRHGYSAALATKRHPAWWGKQACTCHGEGRCLCCRRFDRAICAHQERVAAMSGY